MLWEILEALRTSDAEQSRITNEAKDEIEVLERHFRARPAIPDALRYVARHYEAQGAKLRRLADKYEQDLPKEENGA